MNEQTNYFDHVELKYGLVNFKNNIGLVSFYDLSKLVSELINAKIIPEEEQQGYYLQLGNKKGSCFPQEN